MLLFKLLLIKQSNRIPFKANQGTLGRALETWFKQTETSGWAGIDYETVELAHHRLETRPI